MSYPSFYMSNENGSTISNQALGEFVNKYLLDNGLRAGVIATADFYAVMPGDNAATIAVGADLNFPNDGPIFGTDISRLTANTFQLARPGIYQVMWQVSVDEAGQFLIHLNSGDIATSTAGRATGTNQIAGMALVQTTVSNSILSIRNPAGNATALTITPIAGGAHSVSAHLVITRLA